MKTIQILIIILFYQANYSQEKDFDLPKGNEKYSNKEYANAESNYRISKSNFKKNPVSAYNLGNAIYKQKQSEEAKSAYLTALESAKSKIEKHRIYHNLGNTLMNEKKYDLAAEAYKNALRNNPNDEETRYNYALAKKNNKENPKKDDDKKDKNKKDDKKEDKKEDKKDQDKNKPNHKQNDQNKPQPKPNNANKNQMQNLLEAVNNEEKKIQDKVNGNKVKGKAVENEKDW